MTRTQNIVHAAAAVARELAELPLDTLPEICTVRVEEHTTEPGVRVSAQISTRMRRALAGSDTLFVPPPAADLVVQVTAWRAALPDSHLEATRVRPGEWQVAVVGALAGVATEVWDVLRDLPPAVDRRASRAGDPVAAAAVIVAAYDAAPAGLATAEAAAR